MRNCYGSFNNDILSDLYSLFISYYNFNSFEFIIVGLMLLLGSVICVTLNRFIYLNKVSSYSDFLKMFDFFKDFTKFLFIRRQDLNTQSIHIGLSRMFFKK